MVRRRHSFLLVLSLVCFAVLYVTITQRSDVLNNLYPPLNTSDLKVSALDVVPLKLPIAANGPSCQNGSLVFENFCVISPYKEIVKNSSSLGQVTLCTQGSVEFLHHVAVLCNRWARPISVAVYSPREDYVDSRISVELLRQCDSCVRYWVNWHFFMSKDALPLPPYEDNWQLVSGNCSSLAAEAKPRKRRSNGTYPINVGRNIARREARTPYVFSIDIELYPSLYIPAKFERMLRSQQQRLGPDINQVWVFPVFEVHSRFRAPLVKYQLRAMFSKKQAISFHQYRCNICHKIPNLTQWIAHGDGYLSEVEESLEPLRVWDTVERNRRYKLQEWEPFFIGTTKDPEFDIRLSWEGKQNKMQMAFEMCIRNYNFHIVENAFLVHTPGINVYNASKEKERVKHSSFNSKVITDVKRTLIRKYGNKNKC